MAFKEMKIEMGKITPLINSMRKINKKVVNPATFFQQKSVLYGLTAQKFS